MLLMHALIGSNESVLIKRSRIRISIWTQQTEKIWEMILDKDTFLNWTSHDDDSYCKEIVNLWTEDPDWIIIDVLDNKMSWALYDDETFMTFIHLQWLVT